MLRSRPCAHGLALPGGALARQAMGALPMLTPMTTTTPMMMTMTMTGARPSRPEAKSVLPQRCLCGTGARRRQQRPVPRSSAHPTLPNWWAPWAGTGATAREEARRQSERPRPPNRSPSRRRRWAEDYSPAGARKSSSRFLRCGGDAGTTRRRPACPLVRLHPFASLPRRRAGQRGARSRCSRGLSLRGRRWRRRRCRPGCAAGL